MALKQVAGTFAARPARTCLRQSAKQESADLPPNLVGSASQSRSEEEGALVKKAFSLGLLALLLALPTFAAPLRTTDGLTLQANLPTSLGALALKSEAITKATGGLVLIDPKTGQAPAPGRFKLSATATAHGRRIVIAGWVKALGTEETICALQARIPVGEAGWLWWDDVARSRPLIGGSSYQQTIYPLACVTSADRRLGLAVGVDPEPVQPATFGYDVAAQCLTVNWQFGFSPLAAPALRMQAPFRFELYRTEPGWAFRSALEGFYSFHPRQFDQRAKYEGLWLFASGAQTLPNPQHYAYNEGGPPTTADKPRGIYTFPYTCTGDLTIALPPAWGVPKTYEEMLDRLQRWEKLPRVPNWEKLTAYEIDDQVFRSGRYSMKFTATTAASEQTRQTIDLNQKKTDPVTVSVWTRAQDVSGGKDADYSLWLDLEMADGTTQFGQIAPADPGTHDWQQLKLVVGEDKPVRQIRLYLLLRGNHAGTAWWDDVSITTASAPGKNWVLTPGFESIGPPPEAARLRANVMYDQNDHMRYFADTWGGADVGPASPINWLRFVMLTSPDQKPTAGQQTEVQYDMGRMADWFKQSPDCAGNYFDGTSAGCTTTWEYRREHLYAFSDPLMYQVNVNRPCGNGMAAAVRYIEAYERQHPGKLSFGNVWASTRMFPIEMALDVPGYESSRWYDLPYADYYRAAAYHKPGLYLNYFRLGQQLDTREGGERFFRYATAYGIFPSIGRFTDEAYEKFGDLQHLYIPIVKRLFRAGWEPVPYATTNDPAVRVERYGRHFPAQYFTLLNPTDAPRVVRFTVTEGAFGLWDKYTEAERNLVAVEMATSAALPLAGRPSHGNFTTSVALGPQDVAVLALLPRQDLGAWYRGRAADLLQGASYVYASTPPTNATAALAKQVAGLAKQSSAQIATATSALLAAVSRLEQDSGSLPEDLKRLSYRRDLAEARRLLTEGLLADTGARVGWAGTTVAALDGQVSPQAKVLAAGGGAQVTGLQFGRDRLVETGQAALTAAPTASAEPLALRLADPARTAVTLVATVAFTDVAGVKHDLQRRGYAWFGPISELSATYDGAGTATVRLRNADTTARVFKLSGSAPGGLQLTPDSLDVSLAPGESRAVPIKLAFAPGLASGDYALSFRVALPDGMVVSQAQVTAQYVLPLEAGDLALAATGAQVAVDSAYYAYSEKPLNDGVVTPTGAFNEGAWAAAETDTDHWVQLTWPAPQAVGRVVIYWNVENGTTWSARRFRVEAKVGDQWVKVAETSLAAAEPVSTASFAPVTTTALRVVQPKGEGPAQRANIMWLREVAVYAR